MNSLRIFFARLPRNLRTNRWWVFWAGRLYLRTRSVQSSKSIPHGQRYTLWWRWLAGTNTPSPAETGCFVSRLGRFGNTTLRLARDLTEATAYGLGHFVVPGSSVFDHGDYRPGVHHRLDRPTIWFAADHARGENYPNYLVLKTGQTAHKVDPVLYAPASTSAWGRLREMLECDTERPALPSDHLVVHVRGGDVFSDRIPSNYGQPPLAYYEFILNLEQWSAVTVVHEDWGNPVLEPMVALLRKLGIGYQLQSSNRLLDDLGVLLSARTLVAGRGTFIPAVAGLSRHLERIYYFENKCVLDASLTHLSVHRVYDAEGSYTRSVLSDNWRNSQAQREMMTGYPVSALAMETIQP